MSYVILMDQIQVSLSSCNQPNPLPTSKLPVQHSQAWTKAAEALDLQMVAYLCLSKMCLLDVPLEGKPRIAQVDTI